MGALFDSIENPPPPHPRDAFDRMMDGEDDSLVAVVLDSDGNVTESIVCEKDGDTSVVVELDVSGPSVGARILSASRDPRIPGAVVPRLHRRKP